MSSSSASATAAAINVETTTEETQQQAADLTTAEDEATATTEQQRQLSNGPLRKMRLEEASFRLSDPSVSKVEPEQGAIVSLTLTSTATTKSNNNKNEHLDLVLTTGDVYKLLSTLRGMTRTIASLSSQQQQTTSTADE